MYPYKITDVEKWVREVRYLIEWTHSKQDETQSHTEMQIEEFFGLLEEVIEGFEGESEVDECGEPWVQRGPVYLERMEWFVAGAESTHGVATYFIMLLEKIRDIKRMHQARHPLD